MTTQRQTSRGNTVSFNEELKEYCFYLGHAFSSVSFNEELKADSNKRNAESGACVSFNEELKALVLLVVLVSIY